MGVHAVVSGDPKLTMSPTTLLLSLALWQTTPSGGAIAKYVPPVPTPASFISDQRSVLTADQRRALDARITAVQQAGLGDIAVAILPSVGPYTPNQVAVEIYRTWKVGSVAAIGSAHKDVGVLLLIVPKELAPDGRGQCWINTGLGSEGLLTDARAAAICRDSIIPRLRAKDYAGAIGAGIGAIESRMRSDPSLTTTPADDGARERGSRLPPMAPLFIIAPFVLLFGIVGAVKYRRNRARTCPRCGRRMRRLEEAADDAALDSGQRLEEKLKSIDYDVWTCECGESKVIPYRAWFSKYSECRRCHRRTASSVYDVLVPATTVSTGMAEKRFTCAGCGEKWTQQVILPRIVRSSSSSGGGGGGSSFGGSGATSGGGGGGSY
jgi:uncharacterized protein